MSHQPFETNYAGAIYGTMLSMAVISTLSKDDSIGPVMIAVWAVATAFVFFLAHVYADIVAAGIARPSQAKSLARSVSARQWPMVQGALIPAAAMLLAPLGLVADDNASYVAVYVGVVVLFFAGLLVGSREDLGWVRMLTIGTINAFIGVLIVLLKIFVH